jgi:hypothetical protein
MCINIYTCTIETNNYKTSNLLGEELGLNELVGARLGLVDGETEGYADVVGA